MLKLFTIYLFVLISFLEVQKTHGSVAILPPQEKPAKYANEKGCYVKEFDKVLPPNQPYSPKDGKSCVQYTCGSDGFTSIFACGSVAIAPGQILLPGDKNLAYPECCDSVAAD